MYQNDLMYIIAYVKTAKKIRFIIHYVKPTAQLLFRIRFQKGGPTCQYQIYYFRMIYVHPQLGG